MQNNAAYHVLVLAPFAPVSEQSANLKVMEINPENPASSLAKFAPVTRLTTHKPTDFAPRSLKDFHPLSLVSSLDCFSKESQKSKPSGRKKNDGSIVDNILSMVDTSNSTDEYGTQSPSFSSNGILMNQVLADRQFRDLQAAWQGLSLLYAEQDKISLSALAVNRTNILATLQELIQELADTPPDLILLGLDLNASPADLEIMRGLAKCADQLLTCIIFGLSAEFFGSYSWSEQNKLQYLPHHLQGSTYASFKSLAKHQGACRLIPVTGQAPCRKTYSASGLYFDFADPGAANLSPAFILTAAILKQVQQTGWPTATGSLPELKYSMPEQRARELENTGITALAGGIGSKGQVLALQNLCAQTPFIQLCYSRLTGFLFRLRQKLAVQDPKQLSTNIYQKFKELFALYGQVLPEDIQIKAELDHQNQLLVNLSVQAGQYPLSLSLYW